MRGVIASPAISNLLLAALPRIDRDQLLARCELVEMQAGESLYEAGEPIRFVFFPTGSFASLLARTDKSGRMEVALVGAEGMWGMSSMLEVTTAPLRARVQGAGSAWRMETGEFLRQVAQRPALFALLSRYLYVLLLDLAQMVTCTRFHLVEPRLARWLLMAQDRVNNSDFRLTQQLIASALGVRRSGVTVAAGALQARGLITYHRGFISILDRRGLERAACTCYARSLESYARYIR